MTVVAAVACTTLALAAVAALFGAYVHDPKSLKGHLVSMVTPYYGSSASDLLMEEAHSLAPVQPEHARLLASVCSYSSSRNRVVQRQLMTLVELCELGLDVTAVILTADKAEAWERTGVLRPGALHCTRIMRPITVRLEVHDANIGR